MPESPHPAILDRDEPRAVVNEHLSQQMELLRDLANYGSNLVIRTFNASPKKMTEVIVCGVLLKQVVAMVDAAEVLLSAGCGHASFLPARTAFEASIYIDWILNADSERRATRFIVSNYRDERLWSERVIPGTTEAEVFQVIAQRIGLDVHANRPTLTSDAISHLEEVNRILEQSELAPIDREFEKYRTDHPKLKRDPEWYELDGIRSIRQIANKVGRLPEYEFFYSKGSQVAHTGSYKDHLRFADSQIKFKPIRHLADINMLLNFIVSICIQTYKRILERYRPGETMAFMQKYVEEWRDPFTKVTPIKYNF
jgi:hypothetical protein